MLIKEYRIPLPFTVEEYKIAYKYMESKKGENECLMGIVFSVVDILADNAYTDGPGGKGQFTHKVYRTGIHQLPIFLNHSMCSAREFHKRSWNAYSYRKELFTFPGMENVSIEIETTYSDDCGTRENVFQLSKTELSKRMVEVIDIVNDRSEEAYGPVIDLSVVEPKTGRGSLSKNWIKGFSATPEGALHARALMCTYKLCRVECKRWMVQSQLERFIHDNVIRRSFLEESRQVWLRQDEWLDIPMKADSRPTASSELTISSDELKNVTTELTQVKTSNNYATISNSAPVEVKACEELDFEAKLSFQRKSTLDDKCDKTKKDVQSSKVDQAQEKVEKSVECQVRKCLRQQKYES